MEARRSDANRGFTSKHEVWRVEKLRPPWGRVKGGAEGQLQRNCPAKFISILGQAG